MSSCRLVDCGDISPPCEAHKGEIKRGSVHDLPFRQLYDTQILEIQIRGWIMRL